MEKIDSKTLRTEAGTAALLFGIVSGGYVFMEQGLVGFFTAHVWLSELLWAVKLVGLIWLMKIMMARLSDRYEGVGRVELKRYGNWIAFFSALITALCTYLSVEILFPEAMTEAMDAALEAYSSLLDSNSRSILDSYEQNLGTISMMSSLIWCFLYGSILSSILSSRQIGRNPFGKTDGGKDDDDDII